MPRDNNHKLCFGDVEIYFRSLLIWEQVAAEKVKLVTLAYILGELAFKQFGRSFI